MSRAGIIIRASICVMLLLIAVAVGDKEHASEGDDVKSSLMTILQSPFALRRSDMDSQWRVMREAPVYLRPTIASLVIDAAANENEPPSEKSTNLVRRLVGLRDRERGASDLLHARELVAAFENGLVESGGATPRAVLDEVRKRYSGRILPNEKAEYERSYQYMHELLSEWQPYGRPIGELEEIVGVNATVVQEQEKKWYQYSFDSGFGGIRFDFEVSGNVISRVRVVLIN